MHPISIPFMREVKLVFRNSTRFFLSRQKKRRCSLYPINQYTSATDKVVAFLRFNDSIVVTDRKHLKSIQAAGGNVSINSNFALECVNTVDQVNLFDKAKKGQYTRENKKCICIRLYRIKKSSHIMILLFRYSKRNCVQDIFQNIKKLKYILFVEYVILYQKNI